MLVDSHLHVWDPARIDYPWLAGTAVLNRAFLPAQTDRAGGAATHAVFVQADCRPDQALSEARWVMSEADAWPELAAIVAAADLRAGAELDSHLDALTALGDAGARPDGRRVRVAGISHVLQGESDDALTCRVSADALVSGLRRLAERGFTFDICVRHRQLNTVIDLLERVPELPTVLDHVGKPSLDDGIESAQGRVWAAAIDRLSALPRARVKLSGLAAEASDRTTLDAHAQEFLVHALHAFGADRAMIGSDWPVSALTGAGTTLAGWRERVRLAAVAAGVTDDGVRRIEAGTAATFYGLPSTITTRATPTS